MTDERFEELWSWLEQVGEDLNEKFMESDNGRVLMTVMRDRETGIRQATLLVGIGLPQEDEANGQE